MCITGLIAGTVASSVVGGIGAKKAADAQADAAESANETQRYIFDRSVELTEPQREIGQNALAAMAYEMGLGPMPNFSPVLDDQGNALSVEEFTTPGEGGQEIWPGMGIFSGEPASTTYRVGDQSFGTQGAAENYLSGLQTDQSEQGGGWQGFKESPGYKFRLDQGQESIRRMAAANGTLLGGNTLKAAMEYGEGTAANEYGNWWNRLAGMSQGGQQANAQQIQAGQNYGNAANQNFLSMGNAQASGYMGMNNAFQSGMNNMFNIYGMQQAGMFS